MRQLRMRFARFQLITIIIVLLFTLYPITANAAKTVEQFKVTDGIKYKDVRQTEGKVNQAIRILEIDTKDPYIDVELGTQSILNGRQSTTAFSKERHTKGHAILGAINGSFFHIHGPTFQLGMPMNLVANEKSIFQAGEIFPSKNSYVNEPIAFGVDKNGKYMIEHFKLDLNYVHNKKRYPITTTNKERLADNTILYTSNFPRKTTETNIWGKEIVVVLPKKLSLQFGTKVVGKVESIRNVLEKNNSSIPKNGFVISVTGTGLNALENVKVGDDITLEATIDQKWQGSSFMLASGPILVKNGKQFLSMNPNSSNAGSRAPRSAIAIDKTGKKVFFVTVDGRQPGYSNGMTLTEFSRYLTSLGVDQALNLDGGGSTTMSVRHPGKSSVSLANRPSDKFERAVPNILMAVSSQVFSDVKSSHWALAEITSLSQRGTINGLPDGTFRAEDLLTREQAAIMLTRELKLDTTHVTNPGFKDISLTDKYYKEIAAVVNKGIFKGQSEDRFAKDATLTRAEMAVLLQRVYEIKSTGKSSFPDVTNENHYAYDAINAIADHKITTGLPDGTFKPNNKLSRAEFSAFLVRAYNLK